MMLITSSSYTYSGFINTMKEEGLNSVTPAKTTDFKKYFCGSLL